MALMQNMTASSTTLNHEIQIHNMQIEYASLLLTAGYDSSYCFTPAVSCIVPAEVQRYILPFTLSPTSFFINSSRQYESMKKMEVRPTSPCKLIVVATPKATFSKNKLGRLYNPGRPLAMEERQKILHLYKEGYRISHIARIIGVTHSCVSKIMARYRRTGSVQPRTICSSKQRNADCNSGMNDDTVSNNIRNYAEAAMLMLLESP